MTDLPYSTDYIQVEETDFRSPVSERAQQKQGGAINFLLDQNTANIAAIATINSRIASGKNLVVIYDSTLATIFSNGTLHAKVQIASFPTGNTGSVGVFTDNTQTYQVSLFDAEYFFPLTSTHQYGVLSSGVTRTTSRFPVLEWSYGIGVGLTTDFGCRLKIFEIQAI